MIVKKDMSDITDKLDRLTTDIECIISDYLDEYADYGWDNFTETLSNVAAQIYMLKIMSENATVKEMYI